MSSINGNENTVLIKINFDTEEFRQYSSVAEKEHFDNNCILIHY